MSNANRRKSYARKRRSRFATQVHGLKPMVILIAFAFAACGAHANDVLPAAPSIVAGSVTINRNGSQQTVVQSSTRAVVDWGSFSIGRQNSVVFVQPSSSSVVLNRVTGSDASSIQGYLGANGQVFLVNPNGVFFGAGSRLDTGALVATTMSIANQDFMAGRYAFERGGSGAVENAGLIRVGAGGFVLLAGDSVKNTKDGQIQADRGHVALVSADRVTIDSRADGLVGFSVDGSTLRQIAQVENAGAIIAQGGQISMSARGARELAGLVVNNSGVLRADSVEQQGGSIILSATSGNTHSTGNISAAGQRGGTIQVTNESGAASVAGTANAAGVSGGGTIIIAGKQTGIFAGAALDASGATGGTVRIGGEYRGGAVAGTESEQTYVAQSATIRADGMAGQGGSAVVWASDATRFEGTIQARGTGTANGGSAEVSGKQSLAFTGQADLRALGSGQTGTLLLDPTTLTIQPGAATKSALDASFSAKPGNTITAATADAGDNGISTGTLVATAANSNILLEATGQITVADLTSEKSTLSLPQGAGNSVTIRSTTSGGIRFANFADTVKTAGGNLILEANGTGVIDVGNLESGAGTISLTSQSSSSNAIRTGNLITTGQVAYSAVSGGVTQRSGTIVSAGSVNASASTVTLSEGNKVSAFSANVTGGSLNFKSVNDLTVNSVSMSGGGGVAMDIRSDKKMTVVGPVSAQSGGNTSAAAVRLSSEQDMTITGNVSAQGGGTFGQVAALTALTSDAGAVKQTGGQIKAVDIGAKQVDSEQLAHSAVVQIQAGKRAIVNKSGASGAFVQTVNVLAQSDGGRAQVSIDGPNGVTSGGTITSLGASQPGITISAEIANSDGNIVANGDVNTSGAVLKVTQTAESGDAKKPDINKVTKGSGGVGIGGNNLNLGSITSDSSSAGGVAFYGIATNSLGNTTFNNVVKTTAQAGIVGASRSGGSVVSTTGAGLLDSPTLGLSGGKDAGIFKVTTKVGAFTQQGGRAIDLDNSAYSGVLTIAALGRVSEATKNPADGSDIPATNFPVGGVKIRSEKINLLSLDNNSGSTYSSTGAGATRQDLVLIADVLDSLPGTISVRTNTTVRLTPFTANRPIQFVYTVPDTMVAGTTYYTAGPNGLFSQFNPDSSVIVGGTGYGGRIDIGAASDTAAKQITLGKMNLYFETTGRVYNNYAVNPDSPTYWNDVAPPRSVPEAAVGCGLAARPCLSDMTTASVYIKDSLVGANSVTRDVKITGTGGGTGGKTPPPSGPNNNSGGGGGGGSTTTPGGSGSGNNSQPGGTNAPPTGNNSTGNTNTDPGSSATTGATSNPGTNTGNPGGSTGVPPVDPSVPGSTVVTPGSGSTPLDSSTLAGGGEFSGDPGTNPSGGGTLVGDPDPPDDPGGGGTFSGTPAPAPGPDSGTPSDPGGGGTFSGHQHLPRVQTQELQAILAVVAHSAGHQHLPRVQTQELQAILAVVAHSAGHQHLPQVQTQELQAILAVALLAEHQHLRRVQTREHLAILAVALLAGRQHLRRVQTREHLAILAVAAHSAERRHRRRVQAQEHLAILAVVPLAGLQHLLQGQIQVRLRTHLDQALSVAVQHRRRVQIQRDPVIRLALALSPALPHQRLALVPLPTRRGLEHSVEDYLQRRGLTQAPPQTRRVRARLQVGQHQRPAARIQVAPEHREARHLLGQLRLVLTLVLLERSVLTRSLVL